VSRSSLISVECNENAQQRKQVSSAVVRFAGDSGDGMQLTGGQFTLSTATQQNNLLTFPDFPAEIRAPIGTTFGVSSFQINFGSREIRTAGDRLDCLVAMNPAALKVEIGKLKPGGVLIVDTGAFSERNYKRAGYKNNPLEGDSLNQFTVINLDISAATIAALKGHNLSKKESLRCKNLWALGLTYYLYGRDRDPTVKWLRQKFSGRNDLAAANIAVLHAGYKVADSSEFPTQFTTFQVGPADEMAAGVYRAVTGSDALAWGLSAGSHLADLKMIFASYPITPASPLLHSLASMEVDDIVTFQAEDEIAAICAAIGASYAGSLGVTSSSGPGISLKTEGLGLAVSAELPLIVVNSQRSGPSTGMPTKTEQSDLFQALFGRSSDSPVVVLAPFSPGDCFTIAIEAIRIAISYMTPVIILTDTFIANASEPWLIPDVNKLDPIEVKFCSTTEGFHPYRRGTERLDRPWVKPGTPGLEHRIGGLERDYDSGKISYEPDNHHKMTVTRYNKVKCVRDYIGPQTVTRGPQSGKVAVVGWGSTYGPISRAVDNLLQRGMDVSHIHLRNLWPLPKNLKQLLANYETVLVIEANLGQLLFLIKGYCLIDAKGFNKVSGQPFMISEVEEAIIDVYRF